MERTPAGLARARNKKRGPWEPARNASHEGMGGDGWRKGFDASRSHPRRLACAVTSPTDRIYLERFPVITVVVPISLRAAIYAAQLTRMFEFSGSNRVAHLGARARLCLVSRPAAFATEHRPSPVRLTFDCNSALMTASHQAAARTVSRPGSALSLPLVSRCSWSCRSAGGCSPQPLTLPCLMPRAAASFCWVP